MSNSLTIKNIKHFARKLFVSPINNRTRKHIIDKFAVKHDLNYIGYVDQHSSQDNVFKGFSVSQSHEDNHYCVGQINKRKVELVDRVDAVWKPDGSAVTKHNWVIMSFRLQTPIDVPHFFVHAKNHDSDAFHTLFATHPTIKAVELGTFENYSHDFTSRFDIYSVPSASISIEKLLPNQITRVIGAHFWPLSTECRDNVIYIYAENKQVTMNLLETMIKCGLWLSDHIDQQSKQI